jgi:hypothetical protein
MENQRLRITLVVGAMALLALSALWFAFYSPTPKPPSLINITRKEYEDAHNRWQQKGVIDYMVTTREITASSNCLAKAKVTGGGKQANIDGHERCQGRNRYATVEWLFTAIDERLKATQNPGEQDKLTRWLVEFDPELGYPRSLVIEAENATRGGVITSTTIVEQMNILNPIIPETQATP